jgi:cation transport regulator ChaB
MPYATNADLPPPVRGALKTERLQTAWRKAFNAASEQYKGDDKKAFATAWAEINRIATRDSSGNWRVKPKYAKPAKKRDLLGQIVALFSTIQADDGDDGGDATDAGEDDLTLRGGDDPYAYPGLAEVTGSAPLPPRLARVGKLSGWTLETVELRLSEEAAGSVIITKVDEDRRLVMGWATVCTKGGEPVVDLQGHIIPPHVMEEAYQDFMLSSRRGNDMHDGEVDAVIVECCCLTEEKQAAMGITNLGMEGTFVVMKVLDDAKWADVKAGNRPMFSIGGRAWFEEVADAA